MTTSIVLTVNGARYEVTVEPRFTLADILRDHLRLTGTNLGCEQGVCGSCTVLLDGEAIRSCLTFAVQCDGRQVTTVESLADGDDLHPLQEAFHRHHALQCGYCTPGFLMTAVAALRGGYTSDDDLEEWLGSNLCRCTGYHPILAAVKEARTQIAEERS